MTKPNLISRVGSTLLMAGLFGISASMVINGLEGHTRFQGNRFGECPTVRKYGFCIGEYSIYASLALLGTGSLLYGIGTKKGD